MNYSSLIVALLLLVACTKDKNFTPSNTSQQSLSSGDLVINEFVASGSSLLNEMGTTADWFEIYNTTTDTFFLEAYTWFFSDDLNDLGKFTLSTDTFIAPKQFLIVFCDNENTVQAEIHTNFGLSGSGESLSIAYTKQDGAIQVMDSLPYNAFESGKSDGRSSDGAMDWICFTSPTPNIVVSDDMERIFTFEFPEE